MLVIGIGVSQISSQFATVSNLGNVLQNLCFIGLLALGMTPVIISGGIDISVGSTMGLAGVVYGVLLQANWPFAPAAIAALLTGLACGSLQWIHDRLCASAAFRGDARHAERVPQPRHRR